ncbi:MAG TPA: hypothetical protein PLD47_14970 [Aggregatilineales bacterium]|nr:hypothetical protein [Anaerolineales bacterium]HRE49028.1 hypothetical protein [Aggregatilineales bacterium]
MTLPERKLTDALSDEDLIRLASDLPEVSPTPDDAPLPTAEHTAQTGHMAQTVDINPEKIPESTVEQDIHARAERLRQQEDAPKLPNAETPTPSARPKVTNAATAKPPKAKAVSKPYERYEFTLPETREDWMEWGIKAAVCVIGAWLIASAIPMLMMIAFVGIMGWLLYDTRRREGN